MFSYSRVECFGNCPWQYKLRYIDKLKTIPDQDPGNALYLGTAIHLGLETGSVEEAVSNYLSNYSMLNDLHIIEVIKLEYLLPKALEIVPTGECEIEVKTDKFIGYIDRLCPTYMDDNNVQHYDLWDYKYTKNGERYKESKQLHIYKAMYEKTHPNCVIDHLYYLIIPKVQIRQKLKSSPPETMQEFRQRLREHLEVATPEILEVTYNHESIGVFNDCCDFISNCTTFPKNPTKLCDWCNFQEYCESNGQVDYMIINENDKRKEENEMYKKLWVYGQPFSGKTTFATAAPDHYVLSTDGNAQYVTDNYKLITDEVTKNGRIEMRKYAWQVLKDEIAKLETEQKYKTIIVDLVEDTYEMARLYMYNKLGISHESDDSFRAWDKIRTEYLSTIRRLMNLPYDIVLISHEDTSKDITKKSGENITAIKPNVTDKVANKIAGMVALVGRAVVENDKYTLQVKTDEVTFGGGRLGINNVTLPLDWNEVDKLFDVKKNGGNK